MQGQPSLCPKGLNPAPSFQAMVLLERVCVRASRGGGKSVFHLCWEDTVCEEFKIHRNALHGGQGTSLRKEVLNFVLICREEEFPPVEEGFNVLPPLLW